MHRRESGGDRLKLPLLSQGGDRSSLIKESASSPIKVEKAEDKLFSSAKIGSIEQEVEKLAEEIKEEQREEDSDAAGKD